MLDQFRTVQVGDHDRCLKGLVDCLHRRHGPVRSHSDDNSVGFLEIRNGTAFTKKLGIAHDVKFHPLAAVTSDRFGDMFTGLHGHRAFVDDDSISGQHFSNFPCHMLHVTEIDRSILLGRRRDCDEDNIGIFHCLFR